MKHKVEFVKQVKIKEGKTLLDAALEADIDITHSCDGKGKCGKCRVKIVKGSVASPSDKEVKALGKERLDEGYRLACLIEVSENVVVEYDCD